MSPLLIVALLLIVLGVLGLVNVLLIGTTLAIVLLVIGILLALYTSGRSRL